MSRVDHSSSDSSEEGEDNGNKIDIHLGSSLISINFWTLSNYSLYVCENCSRKEFIEHFSIDLQAFQNQNNVKEENIKTFFNCINEKHIDITNEEFLDFYKLADYLKIKKFQKELKKFLNSHSTDINFIVLTKLEIMNDNSNDENKPVNLLNYLKSVFHKESMNVFKMIISNKSQFHKFTNYWKKVQIYLVIYCIHSLTSQLKDFIYCLPFLMWKSFLMPISKI